jgi:hypothetical protein
VGCRSLDYAYQHKLRVSSLILLRSDVQASSSRKPKMETSVQIETRLLDELLLDEEGRPLPRPMITVTTDSTTRVILDVQISVGKPSKSKDQTNGPHG